MQLGRAFSRLTAASSFAGSVIMTSATGLIRSSFPARDVETQDHLDVRALPDCLRSLHRHLDGY
jgi:hypothetical protein